MSQHLKALGTSHQTGLHFNLTHGFAAPAQAVGTLILRALLHRLDAASVRQRFVRQWHAFEAYYGQPPAFVDGHQHVHALPLIRRIVIEETRQRNPHAWLRVPHACGFQPKVLVMRALTAGLAASARHAGLACNVRFAGFRKAMADAGLPVLEELCAQGTFEYNSGLMAGEELLSVKPPPSAIFACNDIMATGALNAARLNGIRIPERLSLVGHDNTILAASGRFSSVDLKTQSVGHASIDLLSYAMGGIDKEPRRLIISPELVLRSSTGPSRT